MKTVTASLIFCSTLFSQNAIALPPPEDTPEEILRSEIILYGRSPLTGELLTASEYAQEQQQIAESTYAPEIDPKIRELIFLLQLRKFLRTITPF